MINLRSRICLVFVLFFAAVFSCGSPDGILVLNESVLAEEVVSVSRTGTAFHLESLVHVTTNLSEVFGVYWAARDLENFFLGNHHFVVIVFESRSQARRVCGDFKGIGFTSTINEQGSKIFYTSISVVKDNALIELDILPGPDVQAMKEVINPYEYTSWWVADYDLEGHRISTEESFMTMVMQLSVNFENSESTDYNLLNQNCASWVNTLFKVAGVSSEDRANLGGFAGIDIGEDDLIDETLFY